MARVWSFVTNEWRFYHQPFNTADVEVYVRYCSISWTLFLILYSKVPLRSHLRQAAASLRLSTSSSGCFSPRAMEATTSSYRVSPLSLVRPKLSPYTHDHKALCLCPTWHDHITGLQDLGAVFYFPLEVLGLAGLRWPPVDVDQVSLDGQHHRVTGVEAALVHGHQELQAAQVPLPRHLQHLPQLHQQPGDQAGSVGRPTRLAAPLCLRVPWVTRHHEATTDPGPGPAKARPGVAAHPLAQPRALETAEVSPELRPVPAPRTLAQEIPAHTEQRSAHGVVMSCWSHLRASLLLTVPSMGDT